MVAGFVIGVDGGGTRSRAVAVSIEGERLGEVNGGPLNVNTTETGTFTESLDGLFQQFRDLHRLNASAAVQTVIGTASLFTSLDHGEAARLCGGLSPAERLTVVGDVVSALFGATLGAPGLLVVSGTGSIAAAMDEQGRCRPTGGPVYDWCNAGTVKNEQHKPDAGLVLPARCHDKTVYPSFVTLGYWNACTFFGTFN